MTITTGNYGWKIDQAKETAALVSLIKNGEQTSREPEYSQKAASHSGNDYGNTYVEINLTAQHLYFYANGKLLVESDFVSGNAAKGWSTPAGAYSITYKQRNATLKGQGYATPVSYWMPFNGGIGLHDANWRKTFGGTIYKNGGSHERRRTERRRQRQLRRQCRQPRHLRRRQHRRPRQRRKRPRRDRPCRRQPRHLRRHLQLRRAGTTRASDRDSCRRRKA